jgi:AcrR family transcriptional regulator
MNAFTELLAIRGADVPLYQVARRAGVGQGTLYRHFPERALLELAVYEQCVGRLTELATSHHDTDRFFFALLKALAGEETRCPGLLAVLRGGSGGEEHLQALSGRAVRLLSGPFADAQARGQIRSDLQLNDDGPILFAMIHGALQDVSPADRQHVAARAIEFLTRGVVGKFVPDSATESHSNSGPG